MLSTWCTIRGDSTSGRSVHAALGDPSRLAIVDELDGSDRSPHELQQLLGDPVEPARPPPRRPRGGRADRAQPLQRRRPPPLRPPPRRRPRPAPAAARHDAAAGAVRVHRQLGPLPARRRAVARRSPAPEAASAGTHPADGVHPGAVAAGRRAGLDLTDASPTALADVDRRRPALTITVCDRAHEELDAGPDWLHWSIPDPVPTGTAARVRRHRRRAPPPHHRPWPARHDRARPAHPRPAPATCPSTSAAASSPKRSAPAC